MSATKPRIWPALLVGAGVVPFTWACTTAVVAMLDVLRRWGLPIGPELYSVDGEWTPAAFLFLSVVSQSIVILGLMLLAHRSRESVAHRFALRPGRLSVWMLPVLVLGTFAAGYLGGISSSALFGGASARQVELNRVIGAGAGQALGGFVMTVAVLPALTEELLFRGYVQSRLLRRLPAWAAIGITSVLFAVAHGEPQYMLGILPIGIWLGCVAFWAESIWPSVACHFTNNGLILWATLEMTRDEEGREALAAASEAHPFSVGRALLIAIPLAGFLWALGRFVRSRRRPAPGVSRVHPEEPRP